MEVAGKIKDYWDGTSSEKTQKVCELCQSDNITKQADGFCKDCEEFMCNACFRQHLRAKLNRNHVMVDGDRSSRLSTPGCGSESVVKCKQHGGETIKYYCRKHDAVGCGDCLVLKHSGCKTEFICKLSANFKDSQEFKTLMSKLEQLSAANDRNTEKIVENERNNTMLLEKALEDIRQFRTDISQYLDKVEAGLISEAKAVMSDNQKRLAKLENDCELLSAKIENINQGLNRESFQDNGLFINTVENKQQVSEIETKIAEIRSTCLKEFNFVPDEQLKDIVSSKKHLGRLITTAVALTPKDTQKTEEKTKNVIDKNDAGSMSACTVKVGARVRGIFPDKFPTFPTFPDGTVTKVHSDGTVNVKWDNIKKIRGPYKIGAGSDEVYPF